MVTRARDLPAPRAALATDDERTALDVGTVARLRGLALDRLSLDEAVDAAVGAVALAPAAAIDLAEAARLGPLCARAAERRRPIVLLASQGRGKPGKVDDRTAALAYLRAHGAVVTDDPDAWFEALVLVAAFGAPAGTRTAIVAPDGGWLQLATQALGREEDARGATRTQLADGLDEAGPADVALVDASALPPGAPERVGRAVVIPLVARGEALPSDGRVALVGLRAALAAVTLAGRHSERLAEGLGPHPGKGKVDATRLEKAFAESNGLDRLGDHETKLFLSAYGAAVTRQGVATTPSAAVRFAQTCGFPVEAKVWDGRTPTEAELPVETGLTNPPDVRRAFAAVATSAGLDVGVPIIVRATPPAGRSLAVRVVSLGPIGWTVIVDAGSGTRPAAAPAPLRRVDAEELAAGLEGSRAGDAPLDRAALAELLIKISLAVVDREADVEALELGRVVVGAKGEGALVVDGRTRLRKKRR